MRAGSGEQCIFTPTDIQLFEVIEEMAEKGEKRSGAMKRKIVIGGFHSVYSSHLLGTTGREEIVGIARSGEEQP